jgi:hypothetical protein
MEGALDGPTTPNGAALRKDAQGDQAQARPGQGQAAQTYGETKQTEEPEMIDSKDQRPTTRGRKLKWDFDPPEEYISQTALIYDGWEDEEEQDHAIPDLWKPEKKKDLKRKTYALRQMIVMAARPRLKDAQIQANTLWSTTSHD